MGIRLEIDIAVKGDTYQNEIVPLVLFPFIETSFSFLFDKKIERSWINLEFQIENNTLTMKLIHGKADDLETSFFTENNIEKVIRRLNYYYPDQYELKSTVEPEIMMTNLKLFLGKTVEEIQFVDNSIKYPTYASI
jgi:LytS/YehU family sensor histidine kinase